MPPDVFDTQKFHDEICMEPNIVGQVPCAIAQRRVMDLTDCLKEEDARTTTRPEVRAWLSLAASQVQVSPEMFAKG
jgi:hypothetical protein